jgi:hypothetical protein
MTQPADSLTSYSDDDLTFFALVYQDYDATAACLKDLREHYPSSRVILRSDGDPDPRFPLLASGHRVDFHGESRLFGIENGGAVIERMIELFPCKTNSIFVQNRSRYSDSSAIQVSTRSQRRVRNAAM